MQSPLALMHRNKITDLRRKISARERFYDIAMRQNVPLS
jgi:hypothetical protein